MRRRQYVISLTEMCVFFSTVNAIQCQIETIRIFADKLTVLQKFHSGRGNEHLFRFLATILC